MISEKEHTFVVCAYKQSQFIEECIESLNNQTVKTNIIMATSTPNDFLQEIADKYSLKMIVNPEAKGIGYDFEFALHAANTRYVTIAHQDDLYYPDYTKDMIASMDEESIIGFCDYDEIHQGKAVSDNMNLKIKKILLKPLKKEKNQSRRWAKRFCLALGCAICCPSVTFNRDRIVDELFISDMKSDIDWMAWEKLSKKDGKFTYVSNNLMAHRIHQESETTNVIKNHGRFQEDYYMFQHFWPKPIAFLIAKVYSLSEVNNK